MERAVSVNVVHICNSARGGAGTAAYRLHKALCSNGIKSYLLTRRDYNPEENIYQVKSSIFTKILEHSPLRIGNNRFLGDLRKHSTKTLTLPYSINDISSDFIIQNADIINLHWVGSMLNYRKFFSRIRKPILWTLHDMNPFMGLAHYESDDEFVKRDDRLNEIDAIAKSYKYNSYRSCSSLSIACLSMLFMNKSIASLAFNKNDHFLVRNCIDVKIFSFKDKAIVRNKFGLPQDKRILLFVSQYIDNPRKGFSLLREVINHQIDNQCLYVFVGEKSGINAKNIIELGSINNEESLSEIYSCADALLLPSLEDNLPNTMLEALSCGIPVISFQVGGMKDIIKHGLNGICANEINSYGLRLAIDSFLKIGVSWDTAKISEDAHSMFSPDIVAKNYIEIYRNILKKC